MSCPNAAGTITRSPALDVSITDRSAALPTAVPDVLLFCEHFMARHILCFHITDKFVLSLSPRPLLDSLNDVVRLQELALVQRNLGGWGGPFHPGCAQTLSTYVTHTQTPEQREPGLPLTHLSGQEDRLFVGGGVGIKFIFMKVISSPNTLL